MACGAVPSRGAQLATRRETLGKEQKKYGFAFWALAGTSRSEIQNTNERGKNELEAVLDERKRLKEKNSQ